LWCLPRSLLLPLQLLSPHGLFDTVDRLSSALSSRRCSCGAFLAHCCYRCSCCRRIASSTLLTDCQLLSPPEGVAVEPPSLTAVLLLQLLSPHRLFDTVDRLSIALSSRRCSCGAFLAHCCYRCSCCRRIASSTLLTDCQLLSPPEGVVVEPPSLTAATVAAAVAASPLRHC
jgi:hypothetical protein